MPTKKKSTTPRKNTKSARPSRPKSCGNKSVNIRKVQNGFIVSSYNDNSFKDTQFVEKTKKAAEDRAAGLLKG